ncbi:RIP metalloprotease RseP [Myxococcota bacterium]|nr:RIP metalloprotease RseP [Myxococcota bacterium]MCZ7619423.1 RIP metalloprotease RseP [Myxococcota bacterium]
MTALSFVFAFVLMLGVLIFVHELGHFLVAKLFDVKVLRFSLGFGPAIGFGRWRLIFRRGETEYVVAWLPIGGYVKMVGENPESEDLAEGEDPPLAPGEEHRAFNNKPVWQRLLILFAGPGMNLLLPVLIFATVLGIGMPRPDPVIGTVEPSSPAERAGLAVGDRIVAIAGQPIRWWTDFEETVRTRAGTSATLRIDRDGEPLELEVPIEARAGLDAYGSETQVGFVGVGHSRLAAVIGVPDAEAPVDQTDLRPGDLVTHVGGEPVHDWNELAARYAAASGESVDFRVERAVGEDASPRSLEVSVPARGDLRALGVVAATVLIEQVSPDSPAERAGLERGDLIVTADGEPVGSFASFSERVRASGGQALTLVYARDGKRREVRIEPERREVDTGLGIPDERWLIGITARSAAVPGVMGIDREPNPFVSLPRAVGMTADLTRTFLGGLSRLVTGEVSRKQLAGPIGIAQIAHSAFERGWQAYLSTLVLISINLAILNLLPIPLLDGGQALLVTVEGIKRSPLSLRTRELVQQVGLTFLALLMGLAFWNDLSRHWQSFIEWVRQGAGL